VYALNTLCELEVSLSGADAEARIEEMLQMAQRSGMRELTVRAHLHSAARGRRPALAIAMELAKDIQNSTLGHTVKAVAHRLNG
jgi:hypothetical protein